MTYLPFISLKILTSFEYSFVTYFTIHFPQKYWPHLNVVLSYIYHLFPSKVLTSFEYGFVPYLPLIFLKNSWTISIWFCHLFMTYFLQKYWRHSNMVLTHIYHLLPTKMLESFGYGYVAYLLFICFEILASLEYGSVVYCSRNYFRVLLENLLSYDYVISWQVKCIKSAN